MSRPCCIYQIHQWNNSVQTDVKYVYSFLEATRYLIVRNSIWKKTSKFFDFWFCQEKRQYVSLILYFHCQNRPKSSLLTLKHKIMGFWISSPVIRTNWIFFYLLNSVKPLLLKNNYFSFILIVMRTRNSSWTVRCHFNITPWAKKAHLT